VPLNQGNLASSLANIIATYELTSEDKSLVVMPLFHVHGLMAGQICSFLIVLTHSHLGRLSPALHIFKQHSTQFSSLGNAACSLDHCKSPTLHRHNHHASSCLMTA